MSFPKYEKYKDSGVEWLGEVPTHWEILNGRRVFRNRSEIALREDIQLAASQKYGIIPQSLMIELNNSKVMLALKGTESFRHVEKNDFVISLRSFEGGIEYSNYAGCVSPAYTVLALIKDNDPNFYRYSLKSKGFIAALQSTTDSLRDGKSITYQQFCDIPLVIPTKTEQQVIALFLDRETAKIDELVAEQQRLIEVLKEKRQSVISHAVTRGLNSNVKLKSSGIEWLGDVPAHWKVTPIKAVSSLFGRIGYRGYTTADIVDEGEGAITMSPSNMSNGIVSMEKSTYISWEKYNESPEIMVMPGDVVMVKTGSTFGKVSFVSAVDHPTTINPQLVLFKKITCIPRFLFFMLNTTVIRALIEVNNSGSTIPTMSQESIGNFRFSLPTRAEQEAIVEFIDRELLKLATLNAEAQRAIDLLQERRTALISAAVTGKIDVRQLNKN